VGILFRKGRVVKKFPEGQLLQVLLAEVRAVEEQLGPKGLKGPKDPNTKNQKTKH
jgi:hypothetical protein